jgi:hypothetical protein
VASAHTVAGTAVASFCVKHKSLEVLHQQAWREVTAGFAFAEKIPCKGDILFLYSYGCLAKKAFSLAWDLTVAPMFF